MKNLIQALVNAQLQIKAPKRDKKGQFKNEYASLDAIYNSCREVLAKNGLILSHSIETCEAGYYLLTTVHHVSGETLSNKFPMATEKAGPQGIAAARTYACRYATCNLLALPSEEDDDGESAQNLVKESDKKDSMIISIKEAIELERAIDEIISPVDSKYKERALSVMGVSSFSLLTEEKAKSMRKNIAATIAKLARQDLEKTS